MQTISAESKGIVGRSTIFGLRSFFAGLSGIQPLSQPNRKNDRNSPSLFSTQRDFHWARLERYFLSASSVNSFRYRKPRVFPRRVPYF